MDKFIATVVRKIIGERDFLKWSLLLLRVGLAFTLIYAGVDILIGPTNWIGFVPGWIGNDVVRAEFLTIHAFMNIALGALLVVGFWVPLVSFVVFFDMASIVVFYGIDQVTFRDVGLTLAALALFFLSLQDTAPASLREALRAGNGKE